MTSVIQETIIDINVCHIKLRERPLPLIVKDGLSDKILVVPQIHLAKASNLVTTFIFLLRVAGLVLK